MASKKTKFMTGLFVLSGLFIGAAIIIWAGASDIFLKGSFYNVYFDESVQGLQVDSAVKYRGVEIGKVVSIQVAPDNALIEVVMKISLPPALQSKAFAQLKTAGITGIVFIELDRITPGIDYDFLEVSFNSDYPLIPSRRSDTSRFLTDANTILQKVKAIDLNSISEQIRHSAHFLEKFLTDRRIDRILANLESASRNLDNSATGIKEKIETIDTAPFNGAVSDLTETIAETRGLVEDARQELKSMKVQETMTRAGDVIDAIGDRSRAIAIEMQDTAEHLRAASEQLEALTENLKKNPAELIFNRPAPPRKPLE
jgi:phospholipid/cholesterol/gamma-HCH transport system substrate-binding protein